MIYLIIFFNTTTIFIERPYLMQGETLWNP